MQIFTLHSRVHASALLGLGRLWTANVRWIIAPRHFGPLVPVLFLLTKDQRELYEYTLNLHTKSRVSKAYMSNYFGAPYKRRKSRRLLQPTTAWERLSLFSLIMPTSLKLSRWQELERYTRLLLLRRSKAT